ncbi:MAG TPA: rod shape-determining protein MreD [Salinimicrobium sp.]|nr:rod shape-determining protein MreD [Salinimicrobium sp.]
MSSNVFLNIFRFLLLLFLQVLLLNNINLFGYLNPQLYILFIILFPIKGNQTLLLISSFLLGLSVDLFEDSGGVHALACLIAAYFRPYILRLLFGINYDFQSIKFSSVSYGTKIAYIAYMVVIHHLSLYFFEFFSFSHFFSVLEKTLFSGMFTVIICLLSISIFNNKK